MTTFVEIDGELLPAPETPWSQQTWLDMTQNALWLVWDDGRCILEAGDDAWPEGKLTVPYCEDLRTETMTALLVPMLPPGSGAGGSYGPVGGRGPLGTTNGSGGAPGGSGTTSPDNWGVETPVTSTPVTSTPVAPVPLTDTGLLLATALLALLITRICHERRSSDRPLLLRPRTGPRSDPSHMT